MTKIALLGAAGQIGTPLSLLCKLVSAKPLTMGYTSCLLGAQY